MLKRVLSILLLSCFTSCALNAQWRTLQPIKLNADDGLISLWANIIQDSVGHFYLGTDRGLYIYDGADFEFFAHDADDSTTIGAGPIHAIHESSDGLIYLGFGQDVLQSFSRHNRKFTRYPIPANERGKYTITSIFEDEEHFMWLGSNDGRLIRLNPTRDSMQIFNAQIPKRKNGRNRQNINQIIQDKFDSNVLWLYVLDYDAKDSPIPWFGFMSFNKRTKAFNQVPCGGRLKFQDKQGDLFASFQNKLIKYQTSSHNCQSFEIFEDAWGIMDLLPTKDGILFVNKNGVYELNTDLQPKLKYKLTQSSYAKLFEDRENRLWVSDSKGLSIFDNKQYRIDHFSLSQFGFDNRIYPGRLAYDKNKDVIYLAPGGFSNDFKNLYEIPLNKHLATKEITLEFSPSGICFDKNQNLILTGNHAISVANPTRQNTVIKTLDSEKVPWLWNLQRSENGWIGGVGNKNFYWLHEDQQLVRHISVDSSNDQLQTPIRHSLAGCTMYKDKAYLYSDVIYEVNLITGRIEELKFHKGFNPRSDQLLDVKIDPDSNMWISSIDALELYKQEGNNLNSIRRFTSNDLGFKSGTNELHLSKNQLWLFGYYGLYGLDLKSYESRYFGLDAGLVDKILDPRQIIDIANDRIATVNGNGLMIFHPDSLWNSKTHVAVKTIIKKIRVDGKPFKEELDPNFHKTLDIPARTKIIDLQFQGLAYPNDDGTVYSYRLLGQHKEWIDIGTNKYVSFTSLSPGEYTFQVKASSANVQAPIKSIVLILPTPVYLRWYVLLIASALVICSLFYFISERMRIIQRREKQENERRQKLMEIELKALRSQMNPHFMFNSLNSIKSYILQSRPKIAAEYLSDFAHLVRMILQHSRESLITLEEELETLTLYIDLEKMRLENEFSFSCQVADNMVLNNIQIPPLLLQPFVENAIWHGLKERGNGHLGINITQSKTHTYCIIEDNGIGRAASLTRQKVESKKYRSLGMGITQERAQLINNTENLDLKIEIIDLYDASNSSKGTRVIISFKNQ